VTIGYNLKFLVPVVVEVEQVEEEGPSTSSSSAHIPVAPPKQTVPLEVEIERVEEGPSTSSDIRHINVAPPILQQPSNLLRVCQYLDYALGPNALQMPLSIAVEDFMQQNNLRRRPVPSDGYCMLHSWAESTGGDD